MCFSAEVSFGTGVLISAVGVASVRKATTTPQKILAFIPVLFAVQQFTEGGLWLTFTDSPDSNLNTWLSYFYLFFAWIIWPTYIPYSMRQLETHKVRKQILTGFLVIGLGVSLLHSYHLLFQHVYAQVEGSHIRYLMDTPPKYPLIMGVFYFIPIVLSLFVSTTNRMLYLGVVVLITFLVSIIFYQNHQISIWCFFAAVASLMILWVLDGQSKPDPLHHEPS